MCSNESHFHVPLIVKGKVAPPINVSLIFWNQSWPSFVFFLCVFFFYDTQPFCFCFLLLTDQVKYALKHPVFGPQLLLLYPIISKIPGSHRWKGRRWTTTCQGLPSLWILTASLKYNQTPGIPKLLHVCMYHYDKWQWPTPQRHEDGKEDGGPVVKDSAGCGVRAGLVQLPVGALDVTQRAHGDVVVGVTQLLAEHRKKILSTSEQWWQHWQNNTPTGE